MAFKAKKGLAAPFGETDEPAKAADDTDYAAGEGSPDEEATETPDEESSEDAEAPVTPEGDISLTDSKGEGIHVPLDNVENPPQLSPGTYTSLVTFRVDSSGADETPDITLISMAQPQEAQSQRPLSFNRDNAANDEAMGANMDAVMGPAGA
jgi:hypothetical protein